MYGLPQSIKIEHDDLVKRMAPYGHHTSIKNPGLWTHNSWPIKFTLVVDNCGVKYSIKEHALHLKSSLEIKYKVTTDWEGKFYIGIALKCDHEKGTVQLSVPGYLCTALHSFQH